ncbi:MAG: hypothetical protein K8F25_14210 [Fimbriimonadaceae bacterium]|nr:hypothetical protein [Alphaproteobacteria bacterium]
MIHVEILTEGFHTPNGRAFLFPLLFHRSTLAANGISFELRRHGDEVREADTVVVDSKYLSERWATQSDGVFAELASLKRRTDRLVYADIGDSTGWLQSRVLPVVDVYWKSLLLRDRSLYLKPMYGHRIYTDYYHQVDGVSDNDPIWSSPIDDVRQLVKLRLSWNSGLADYTWLGPYRMAAYERFSIAPLLRVPEEFRPPSVTRPNDLHCRMGMRHSRDTVSHQRRKIAQRLAGRMPTNKISRRHYLKELERSKLVISPFGFGEITLKDFETMLAGALLLKPDMSHVDTWPQFFCVNETMVSHAWDLGDFETTIDHVLSNYPAHIDLAREGQCRYRQHLLDPQHFVKHLSALLVPQRDHTPKVSVG